MPQNRTKCLQPIVMNRRALDKTKQEKNEDRQQQNQSISIISFSLIFGEKGQMSEQRNGSHSGELERKQHQAKWMQKRKKTET